jgi:beta-1,4-mannosyl-glycoprotein beta-1,4-N-acetylglucosaminyltransferase
MTKSQGLIYDCFTFFNELDMLEIRLNILDPIVDKFVLVEATRTQNNKKKPLFYKLNKDRYKKFAHKIIHIVVDKYPKEISQWTIENHQRNRIVEGLNKCNDNDIVMISDLDEIPNPKILKKYIPILKQGKILALDLHIFFLYLNLWGPEKICKQATKILYYKDLKNILDNENYEHCAIDKKINKNTTISKIRLYEGKKQKHISNAGWHFSWLGNEKKTLKKLLAVCEGDKKATINDATKRRDFLLSKLKAVVLNKHFPEYLVKNQKKYKHLIIKPKYNYYPYALIFFTLRKKFFKYILRIFCWFIPSSKTRRKIRNLILDKY